MKRKNIIKYFFLDYSGRANRKEWWVVIFIYTLITVADLYLLGYDKTLSIQTICDVSLLISLWTVILVSIKRLHDTNRSGWWFCMPIVPFIYLGFLKNSKGKNRYGEPEYYIV